MNSNCRYLLLGLVLGSVLTIGAALLAGTTVNVTSSVQESGAGRYELETQQTADGKAYTVFDRERGTVQTFTEAGPLLRVASEPGD